MRKNGKIELMRFIFTIIVVFYHCENTYFPADKKTLHFAFFCRGYIGVEFFFLVTGYLMANSIYKRIQSQEGQYDLGLETIQFTWHKIKAILPYHLVAFSILFGTTMIAGGFTLRTGGEKFLEMLPSLLLIQKAGFNYANLNHVEWYISCMILAVMILYPLCRRYYSMFVHVIAPVGGLFICGYLAQNYGTFTGASRWIGIGYACMFRALAEISLGAVVFEAARVIREKKLTRFKRGLLTVLELMCYGLVFLYTVSTIKTQYEIYAVFLLMIAIALTFSGQVYGNQWFNHPLCYFLGRFSLPIYLSQVLALNWVGKQELIHSPKEIVIAVMSITLVNAAVCNLIVELIHRGCRMIKRS